MATPPASSIPGASSVTVSAPPGEHPVTLAVVKDLIREALAEDQRTRERSPVRYVCYFMHGASPGVGLSSPRLHCLLTLVKWPSWPIAIVTPSSWVF